MFDCTPSTVTHTCSESLPNMKQLRVSAVSSELNVEYGARLEVLHVIVCEPDEKLLSEMLIQSQPGSQQWSTASPCEMATDGAGGGGLDGGVGFGGDGCG